MFNGPLECKNILAHFDSIVNVITPEMSRQALNWGGSMAGWQASCASMRTFITSRCAVIGGKLDTCLDLNPQRLQLNVMPPGSGTIALDGAIKSPYVWSRVIEGDSIYSLKATPTGGQYWAFDHWEKQEPTNNLNPNLTTDFVQFDFKKEDSVIAYFKYFNYDSVNVTFDVNPPGTGTINLNGNSISTYPYTVTLDRRFAYNLFANPATSHKFINWTKNNATTTISPSDQKAATLNYMDQEVVVANFEYVPPPPPPPPLPTLNGVDKSIFIPNAFSPNGDGKNDIFNMKLSLDAIGVDMTIFDRWGAEIYHSSKSTTGWDGLYKGKVADIGTYQYIIKVRYRDNSVESYQGDFTVIR
jgi:gliding motility-associated-like protein